MDKREAPWGLRPGPERAARVDAWRVAEGRNLSRHAAVLALIDVALGGGEPEKVEVPPSPGGPRGKTTVAAAARRAAVKTGVEVAPASDVPPMRPYSANEEARLLAERRAAEARRTQGWFPTRSKK